ncbi:MAG: toll/interleukin-1 receptor domain-containing protein [Gammaproteobacteria bacterium]|nr:toll/interleukin-1 receptor domain-containing protein [Gammaproteobacteria bacterium]
MAFTSGFEYDIFISYSRDDNSVLPGETAGWVSQFRDYLENWLIKRRGLKGLKIWFDDQGLSGNTRFDAEIEASIKKSALFLVLHSHNYQGSDYCRKELQWFMQHNQHLRTGVMVGNESRLFNVLLNNIAHPQWPQELAGSTGFRLHDAPVKSAQFGYPLALQDAAFGKAVLQVVEAATKTLEALNQLQPTPAVTNGHNLLADSRPKIFLADVADTLQPFRKRLITEIGDRAIILPALPPPYEASEHNRQLVDTLEQASLSIHLLDQWGGRAMDGLDEMTFPRMQAGMVRSRATPSLMWVPDTLLADDLEDEQQAAWLHEMEHGKREASGFHFVRSSRQAFIDQVMQELDRIRTEADASGNPSRFLIDTHQKDLRYAFELGAKLAGRELEVEFNKETGDPVRSLEYFEKMVGEVQHLIIMFGKVAPQWVKGRIQTTIKVIANQLQTGAPALDAIWVMMLPECPGQQALPQFPSLIRINCLDNSGSPTIDDSVLEPLFKHKGGRT